TRLMNPETDQQIGGETNQLPADKEQEQTISDDQPEHGGREKGEVGEETDEMRIRRHVAHAENEDPETNEGDHDQHHPCERVEDKTKTQCLFAELKPGEVL